MKTFKLVLAFLIFSTLSTFAQPTLQLTSAITVNPSTIRSGSYVEIKASIKNTGSSSSFDFECDILSTSGTFITVVKKTCNIYIASGATQTVTFAAATPGGYINQSPGNYKLQIISVFSSCFQCGKTRCSTAIVSPNGYQNPLPITVNSPYCGNTTTLTNCSGSIEDKSGTNTYCNNSDCFWLIQPSGASSVTLTFTSFDVETGYDFVKIYDGTSTSSKVLGSFDGASIPSPITTSGGAMLVRFYSDNQTVKNGWSASYNCSSSCTPVSINSNPTDQTVNISGTAKFTVIPTGTAPFTYQWKKNDINISNANSDIYNVTNAQLSDNGALYRCEITNCNGVYSKLSSNAKLTVNASCDAVGLLSHPTNQTVNISGTAKFTVIPTGTAPYTFQWKKNGTNIPNAISDNYTITNAQLSDNGDKYSCEIKNCNGIYSKLSTSAILTVSANCVAIGFLSHPTIQSVKIGETAKFIVIPSGTAPFSFQWKKNGLNITNANSDNYTITNAQLSDNGASYSCYISNCNGNYAATSNPAILEVKNNTNFTLKVYATLNPNISKSLNAPAKICADGSRATRIEVICDDKNYNLKNIRFKIASFQTNNSVELSGYFDNKDYDPLNTFFNHPIFLGENILYKRDTIVAFDKNTYEILCTFPINIFKSPVLFIHGLNSNMEAFDIMKLTIQKYDKLDNLAFSADYRKSNCASFYSNRYIVPLNVKKVLDNVYENNYSAGKVSIIAHSMGGILARLYIQSTYLNYQNDIDRLITLNTPHSGTQMANFLRIVDGLIWVKGGGTGAITDMKVDDTGIRNYLNGSTLSNGYKVPSHAIATVYSNNNLDLSEDFITDIKILAKYFGKSIIEFNAATFVHERNDIVVPLNSQFGGLTGNNVSLISDQAHNGAAHNDKIIDRVNFLLRQNPKGNYFSNNGFAPPTYSFVKLFKKANLPIIDGSVKILMPVNNQEYFAGDSIVIICESSPNVTELTLQAGNEFIESTSETISGNGIITFRYKIPKHAIGEVRILILGFNEMGLVDYDTVKINIKLPIGVELDSIFTIPDNLYLYNNTLNTFRVMGIYSDSIIRPIEKYNEMEISEFDSSIAIYVSDGNVKGLKVDTTLLRVWYLNKTTYLKIKIIEPINQILSGVSLKPDNNSQNKYFNIYPNPNNGEFTIELSTDVGDFVRIEIYNQLGQKVFLSTENVIKKIHSSTVPLNEVPTGMYYIKVTTKSDSYSSKIFITK